MQHFYSDFLFCKNNFFKDPNSVAEFAESLDYNFTDKSFPGTRTENIALLDDPKCVEFSNLFIRKLVSEIYTNIVSMTIDIRFHKYPCFSSTSGNVLNSGWSHIDHEVLAGVLYLNKGEFFEAGTSIFTTSTIPQQADVIREQFNIDSNSVDADLYSKKLLEHNSQFTESVKVGSQFNRLITYDAKMYHKPNDYYIPDQNNRLTLLFVISEYECTPRKYDGL